MQLNTHHVAHMEKVEVTTPHPPEAESPVRGTACITAVSASGTREQPVAPMLSRP